MSNISKESRINKALEIYSDKQINNAYYCSTSVITKDGKSGKTNLPLDNRGKKTKKDKIKSDIRSFLMNIKSDESNKRYNWNTSSENIEEISIELKYKVEEFKINNSKVGVKQIDNILNFENNKIITLIGGNGAGKSRILAGVFENYINEPNINLLAFSSSQNELFTEIFNSHKKNNKRLSRDNNTPINDFYFNYDWSRILVFLAATLKKGYVRQYLNEKGYIEDFDFYLDFEFRIKKNYLDKILYEYERESKGEFIEDLYRKTIFHQYLEKFVNNHFSIGDKDEEYDFLDNPKSITKQISHIRESNFIEKFGKNIEELFTFLFYATDGIDKNIFLESTELIFKNKLEFKKLSDGEYQLLVVYAMIDLFDSENTLFLFDEIDSHLHYTNINVLWSNLKKIKGKILTTTHIPDSIMNNKVESIKMVDKGIINNKNTIKSILDRLGTISDREIYEIRFLKKVKNFVLIDDDIDWIIFKKLVNKKLGKTAFNNLSSIISIKKSSGRDKPNQILGDRKLDFVKDFLEINKERETKNIFLICDRDKGTPLNEIKEDLQVKIHKNYTNINSNKISTNTHLLCWKRLEIENYLLSKQLLKDTGNFNQYNFDSFNLDSEESIATLDCKNITHPLYKDPRYSVERLDKLIKSIPKDEISEDITKMYNFIVSKIED